MSTNKRITVAIPTRNRCEYLQLAIESSLAARYRNVEILVSDNASNDATPTLAQRYRSRAVRWYRQPHDLGMVGNWNFCLREGTGDYFLLLSDDDELLPDSLGLLAEAIQHSRGTSAVAFSYGSVAVINSAGKQLTKGHSGCSVERDVDFIDHWLQSRRSIFPCATLMRRPDLLKTGGYRDRYGPFADVAAWLSIIGLYSEPLIAFVKEPVARYRTHESNLSGGERVAEDLAKFDLLAGDYWDVFAAYDPKYVSRYRAAILASRLRMLARGRQGMQSLEYFRAICVNWTTVTAGFALEPYFRNWLILASPRLYEIYKRVRGSRQGGRR